ncbi:MULTISPECIES: ArsR/SmtB family transcription factor [Bacillus]|uniref:ArsR family transcriptional regulator n=1 Tax=Bacillus glycinifermentans TaxID=1664069 RepID=A0AAJ4D4P9_9BACI|nr:MULTISPECIES: winged helix-turn-helix domain-containing protein [Bacillus]KKB74205.1 hypothetical protein TH62_08465 [Bacillus sp. TH008]MBU8786643.1 winged helix-turn-helix domain-containing protein [Bacillus glycinifermentans]MDU0070475.1 winged helix-turn-helix domain-containing protein [Bacillus sp. IG6]MED8018340.1 winged helix-turn-helix domain-containing protein [Bacillus glycinifermentans]NUJ16562.1 winged helix-turn-helix transcriptional regulator [Bacillus glycinifermentans]
MNKINEPNQLILIAKALGNPFRLQILTILLKGGCYVSELARKLGINRTLLYLHLTKLEEAGVIFSEMKVSSDGKALKYYYLKEFSFTIDNDLIEKLAKQKSTECKENKDGSR